MPSLAGIMVLSGKIEWQNTSFVHRNNDELKIIIPFNSHLRKSHALDLVKTAQEDIDDQWLYYSDEKWWLNFDKLNSCFPKISVVISGWAYGSVTVEPEIYDKYNDNNKLETIFEIKIEKSQVKKYYELNKNKFIFLSHKHLDKVKVREYQKILKSIGLNPWLDEDMLPAGANLERSINEGFKRSCAAVFFVTSSFSDTGFLSLEIDYARQQKRNKNDKFSIITLIFNNENSKLKVPDLLSPYVWKEPKSDLEAVFEILNALPIQFNPEFKSLND